MDFGKTVLLALVLIVLQFGHIRTTNITTAEDTDSDVCKEDTDCKNGAKCVESECECLGKTFGKFCEAVDCSDVSPDCKQSGGSCKYNVDNKTPFCDCPKPKYFNIETKKCENVCKEDTDCKNRAKCVESECECLGKTFGKFCEAVDCSDVSPGCKESGGSCKYHGDNKTPICDCPKQKYFNMETKKCENVCKEDTDCKNGAKCVDFECECLEKTFGKFCETVDCPGCKQSGGSCKYNVENRRPFCDCPKPKYFNIETKKCEMLESVCDSASPKCRETNGHCHVTDEVGNVECVCPEKKEYSQLKGCSVNKCKEKCGAENGVVECEGDPFGEVDVECKCKDEKMTFVTEEKACRRKRVLTLSAIVGIVFCVIAAVVIAVLLFVHYRNSSKKTNFHQNNAETIAFESALYNDTYESMEMRNPHEHRNIP